MSETASEERDFVHDCLSEVETQTVSSQENRQSAYQRLCNVRKKSLKKIRKIQAAIREKLQKLEHERELVRSYDTQIVNEVLTQTVSSPKKQQRTYQKLCDVRKKSLKKINNIQAAIRKKQQTLEHERKLVVLFGERLSEMEQARRSEDWRISQLALQSSPDRLHTHQSTPLHNNMVVTNTPNETQQQSVNVVKVFSSLPPSNQAQTAGTKPLVHIVPSPQGNIEQQSSGSTNIITPEVVSVQSLQIPGNIRIETSPQSCQGTNLLLSSGHEIHLQTPISQPVTSVSNNPPWYQLQGKGPVQLSQQPQVRTTTSLRTTPVAQNQLPQQISTPLISPSMQANYKLLESLKEVNRQVTQASLVSPVSAVIPEATDATKMSPTEIRNQVTVSDRSQYITLSPQTSVSAVAVSASTATLTQQLVQTSTVKSSVQVPVQPIAMPPQVFQVQIIQEPKPNVLVTALQQTVPNIQISQVQSGTSAVASTGVSVTVTTEKVDMPQVNGVKRGHDDDVIGQPPKQKSRMEKEIMIIDDPSPPPQELTLEPEISHGLALDGIDNDLIIKLGKLNREEQWIRLANFAQQLRHLRDNVCKLLRVLVPDIDLGNESEILDDTTVDNLLKQVLEANIQPPGGIIS